MTLRSTVQGRRICIVSPAHLSMNPRTVKEADALAGAGYDVRVIACEYSRWAQESDRAFHDRPWRIARTIPFGPHAPLDLRIPQVANQKLGRLALRLGARNASAIYAAWHPATHNLIEAAQRETAELYIAHYPAALPAAALAARKNGALFAYDAEDFHLGDQPDEPAHELHRIMVEAIEGRFLHDCAYMTSAAPVAAQAYVEHYGIRPPTVVLNVFPRSHAPASATPSGVVRPGPSLYWYSQTIGPHRGLECAVRAIALSECRPHLYLRGQPARGFLAALRTIAGECGVSDRLHILEPATPSELERLASAYDLGLCGEPGHTRNRRISLTNKMFSFILAGTPIVATDIPSHVGIAPEFAEAIQLFRADDPPSLARAIDHYLMHPDVLAAARGRAFALGQSRFNWDVEQQTLLDCVGDILRPAVAA